MSSLVSIHGIFQSLDYMYVLTFLREVELIWMKPWSKMSTLFVMVRYIGLALAILLIGESSISGFWSGNGVLYMSSLTTWPLLRVCQLHDPRIVIMILMVSVMFIQPERIRRILFFLYAIVTVNSIVFGAIWYGPHNGFSVMPIVINAEDGTACQATYAHGTITSAYDGIPKGVFDVLLVALAVYRFIVYSIGMRRITGQHKINEYMILLFKDNVLYFCSMLNKHRNLGLSALTYGTFLSSAPIVYSLFVTVYSNSVPYMLFPRMVLDMRGHRRAASNAFHVNSSDPGSQHLYNHSRLSNGLENDNEEETLG
ncbi:hypothetical protein EV363DRAFT_1532961 [Boletus edulis]|nr:hypothetical protein EV363DRAFT_1532961 [Boletus edulis]